MSSQKLIYKIKISLFILLGLFFVLLFSACESLMPESESDVFLQAKGNFGKHEALLLLAQKGPSVSVEVRELGSDAVLAQGTFAGGLSALSSSADVSGMEANLQNGTLRVIRSVKSLVSLDFVDARELGGAIGGILSFDGTHWLEYNSGLLKRGLEGRVTFKVLGVDGKSTQTFNGLALVSFKQSAVGTVGKLSGSFGFTGWSIGAPEAKMTMVLPHGAAEVALQKGKEIFRFDPSKDLTVLKGSAYELVADRPEYVEFKDNLRAHLRVANVDLGNQKYAHGDADIQYGLTVAISPTQIIIKGETQMDAALRTDEGKYAEFHGANPQFEAVCDW
ncbi:hypothetical protein WDW37_03995 [Bdellovibrionota bacterium FG-1]